MSEDVKELMNKDKDDEALQRWKKQLLGDSVNGAPKTDDPRRIVIQSFGIHFPNGESKDLKRDLSVETNLKDKAFVVKEGVDCCFIVEFKVQHKLISAFQFTNKISKGLVSVSFNPNFANCEKVKMKHVLGRTKNAHSFKSPSFKCPKGLVARGKYKAETKFIDTDGTTHLHVKYAFHIKKNFE